MAQPYNYILGGTGAAEAASRGYGLGQERRKVEQQILAGEQNMEIQKRAADQQFGMNETRMQWAGEDRAAAEAERARARAAAEAQQADLYSLGQGLLNGTAGADNVAEMMLKYPEVADTLTQSFETFDEPRRRQSAFDLARASMAIKSGNPEVALDMLGDIEEAARNSGDKQTADSARAIAETLKYDPGSGLLVAGMALNMFDSDLAKTVFGSGRRVQSTEQLPDGTTVTVFTDGTKEVTDVAGEVLTGDAAREAIKAAAEFEAGSRGANAAATAAGRLESEIAQGGTAAATEAAGKQAVEMSGQAFESLNKVTSNMANIDEALRALEDGAQAGAIAKYFPNVTEASASLQNAMDRLGLDVVGSVTFGALSEGELRLALDVAVPRNLDEEGLREWLTRKRDAQTKASEALRSAAIYLGTPGNTLATWLESQGKSEGPPPDVSSAFDKYFTNGN